VSNHHTSSIQSHGQSPGQSGAPIDQALSRRKIIVTCGTGGVGKTTLSAALAFRAALLGKRTVVITIDPAKRLATSLGLETLGDDPTDLTPTLLAALDKARNTGATHLPPNSQVGTIAAIIPDTKRTFELFVSQLAPTPQVADRVMKNPIFKIFTKEFSGANEYMAMERLYALEQSGLYDCIILDTPPSRNTMAFLDAPKLLAQFFEEKMIRWLILPTNRLVGAGMKKALEILERLTGAGFMTNLLDFAAGLFELQTGFTQNLNRIVSLLESEEVGFVMVTTPTPDTAPEVKHFLDTLQEHRLHFDGVALNRTLSYLGKETASLNREPALEVLAALQSREAKVLFELKKNSVPLCAMLPELARDVHSVEDLLYVALAFDPDRSASER
jgi:anion-transporting  ArsA/GET3 family ATPase